MNDKEKTIIEGKYYNYRKNPFVLIPGMLGYMALVTSVGLIIHLVLSEIRYPSFLVRDYGWFEWFKIEILVSIPGFIFYGGVLFIIIAVAINNKMKKCSLVVTNKRVFGIASFGKRVDLPINQISSVGLGFADSIAVATSSGKIKFLLLENKNEIHRAISDLLISLQKTESKTIEVKSSNADELKKYKELLDSGVITQEEFDAKKKQLLGL